MRLYTLGWFYDSRDMLTHVRYIQFNPEIPFREDGENFGATYLSSFNFKVSRNTYTVFRDFFGKQVPDWVERVNGSASLSMPINPHTTVLWESLTTLDPLSKVGVRFCAEDEFGRLIPFIDYTFKEVMIFNHETWSNPEEPAQYKIDFTYCCAQIHCYDGNRFASHERCKAQEPDPAESRFARERERWAQAFAKSDQKKLEESRLIIKPYFDPEYRVKFHRFDVRETSEFADKVIGPGGLDEMVFHLVEEDQAVDALTRKLFKDATEETISLFKRVNPHIQSGIAQAGQMVMITTKEFADTALYKLKMAKQLAEIEAYRLASQLEVPDFVKNFVTYSNAAGMSAHGISVTTGYFEERTRQIQLVLKELEEGYKKGYKGPNGKLNAPAMAEYRLKKFKELDALLSQSMKADLYGGNPEVRNAHKLGINPRSIEYDWVAKTAKVNSINTRKMILPTIDMLYKNAGEFTNTIKWAGRVAIPLGALETYLKIEEACGIDTVDCEKEKFVQWVGFGGSLAGGALGGALGTGLVFLIIGASGTGLIMAGIGAATIFALTYAGGTLVETGTEFLGSIIYDHHKRTAPGSIEIELSPTEEK